MEKILSHSIFKKVMSFMLSLCMLVYFIPDINFNVHAANFTDTKTVGQEWEKTVSQFFGETYDDLNSNYAGIILENPNNPNLHIYLGDTNDEDYVSTFYISGTDRLRFTSSITGTFTFVVHLYKDCGDTFWKDCSVQITFNSSATYTVTYDKNSGDTEASPTTKTGITSGGNVGTLPTSPTRSGYAFAGWNTVQNGSGTAFTAATAVTGNITVYAQWTAATYTITYHNVNGADNPNPTSYTYLAGAINFSPLTLSGYRFDGWYGEAEYTHLTTGFVNGIYGNANLWAKWTKTYTISGTVTKGGTGLAGVVLSYTDGTANTVVTNASGQYTITVPSGWTGTITPSLTGNTFTGTKTDYSNVTANQTSQDYTAADTDTTAPTVVSIKRAGTINPTNADTVSFEVKFSEDVTGVDKNDFYLDVGGAFTCTSYDIAQIDGKTYTIAINGITQTGTVSAVVKSSGTGIKDIAGNDINDGFHSGEVYTVDRMPPEVGSIVRRDTNPTNASSVRFAVNFGAPVTGVDISDFTVTAKDLSSTSISNGNVSDVTFDGTYYIVTVSNITKEGTIRLDLNSSGTGIKDLAGNDISGGYTAGEAYSIDKSPPAVDMHATPVDNVSGYEIYTTSVRPEFTEGTATLSTDGGADVHFTSNTTISADGTYTLKVTDSIGNTNTIEFKIITKVTISGTITKVGTGVAGVTLSYINGTAKTVTTDAHGKYTLDVPYNWSGTVTPSLTGYTFSQTSRTYNNLKAKQHRRLYLFDNSRRSSDFNGYPRKR